MIYQSLIEIEERSEGERSVVLTISTDAIDRYREVLDPAGVVLKNYEKNPVVLVNHGRDYSLPVGRNMWIKQQAHGLKAKTQFAETDMGNDVYYLVSNDMMKAASVGFLPIKYEQPKSGDKYSLKHVQWELLEYSHVSVPANPEAVKCAMDHLETDYFKNAFTEYQKQFDLEAQAVELQAMILQKDASIKELQERIIELEAKKKEIEQPKIKAPAMPTITIPVDLQKAAENAMAAALGAIYQR